MHMFKACVISFQADCYAVYNLVNVITYTSFPHACTLHAFKVTTAQTVTILRNHFQA